MSFVKDDNAVVHIQGHGFPGVFLQQHLVWQRHDVAKRNNTARSIVRTGFEFLAQRMLVFNIMDLVLSLSEKLHTISASSSSFIALSSEVEMNGQRLSLGVSLHQ